MYPEPKPLRSLLLVLGTAAVLTGCGGSSTSLSSSSSGSGAQGSSAATPAGTAAAAAGAANPCGLVTKDQVTAAVGLPLTDGKLGDTSGKPTCTWVAVDPLNATIAVITVDPSSSSFDAAWKLNGTSGITLRLVNSLGKDAFFWGSGDGSLLEIKAGTWALYVSVVLRPITSDADARQDKADTTLAQIALSHL